MEMQPITEGYIPVLLPIPKGAFVWKFQGMWTFDSVPGGLSPDEIRALLAEALAALDQHLEQQHGSDRHRPTDTGTRDVGEPGSRSGGEPSR